MLLIKCLVLFEDDHRNAWVEKRWFHWWLWLEDCRRTRKQWTTIVDEILPNVLQQSKGSWTQIDDKVRWGRRFGHQYQQEKVFFVFVCVQKSFQLCWSVENVVKMAVVVISARKPSGRKSCLAPFPNFVSVWRLWLAFLFGKPKNDDKEWREGGEFVVTYGGASWVFLYCFGPIEQRERGALLWRCCVCFWCTPDKKKKLKAVLMASDRVLCMWMWADEWNPMHVRVCGRTNRWTKATVGGEEKRRKNY